MMQGAGGSHAEGEAGFKTFEGDSLSVLGWVTGKVPKLEDSGGGPDGWPERRELSGVELVVNERMENDGGAGSGVEDQGDVEPAKETGSEDTIECEREDQPAVVGECRVIGVGFQWSEE